MPLTNEQQRRIERRLRDERERAIQLLNDIVADRSAESQQEETGDLTLMPYHPADLGTDTMDEELDASNATRVSRELTRSEEHTSELQSHHDLVCRLLLEKK